MYAPSGCWTSFQALRRGRLIAAAIGAALGSAATGLAVLLIL